MSRKNLFDKNFIKRLEAAENKSKVKPQTSGVWVFNPCINGDKARVLEQMRKNDGRGLLVPRIPAEQWGK